MALVLVYVEALREREAVPSERARCLRDNCAMLQL
jgi:hypothetical protein